MTLEWKDFSTQHQVELIAEFTGGFAQIYRLLYNNEEFSPYKLFIKIGDYGYWDVVFSINKGKLMAETLLATAVVESDNDV